MVAAGVCHSDLHVVDGEWERPCEMVLGHEGAGIVEELGPGVSERAVGDAASRPAGCASATSSRWPGPRPAVPARPALRGEDWLCATRAGAGHRLDQASVRLRRTDGSAGRRLLGHRHVLYGPGRRRARRPSPSTPEHRRPSPRSSAAPPSPASVPSRNTARVGAGESVVVIGLGGVGLSALMAASTRGPTRSIGGRPRAAQAGAGPVARSDAWRSRPLRCSPRSRRWSSGGPDHVLECIGLPQTVELALRARARPAARSRSWA